jgi:hypothetical protein
MKTEAAPRACVCCGQAAGAGATFTGYVPCGQRRARFSRYCDACRAKARGTGEQGGRGRLEPPVTAELAERFLALAAEYRALARVADDPVYARRLARAANDYRRMAGRGNG